LTGTLFKPAFASIFSTNPSDPMLTIVADEVGRHDFLYSPCSLEMYRIQYGVTGYFQERMIRVGSGCFSSSQTPFEELLGDPWVGSAVDRF